MTKRGMPRDDVKGEHSNDASEDEKGGRLGMGRRGSLAMTIAKTRRGDALK